jgi:hypothetical protein
MPTTAKFPNHHLQSKEWLKLTGSRKNSAKDGAFIGLINKFSYTLYTM